MRDADRVTYSHAAGVLETYAVSAEGLYQSFTFTEPLPGSGDLVVRGRISTELSPNADPSAGLTFRHAGADALLYGAVTGIDAQDSRAPGELRLDGSLLELVLPAEFVADASYPLVLDPLIGPAFDVATSGSNDDADPDVAYNSTGFYLIVWERRYSFSDSDILGQRMSPSGSPVGFLINIATNSNISLNPATASVFSTGEYFVAWQDSSFLAVPSILGLSVDAFTGARSTTVEIQASGNAQFDPDVGGERSDADDDAMVVWQESGVGIRSRQVQVLPSGAPNPFGTPRNLDSGTAQNTPVTPAISKTAGSAGRFLVVWQVNSTNDFIRAQAITRNNATVGDSSIVSFFISGAGNNIEPDVDGDGSDFMVAWARDESLFSGVYDIYCRSVTVDNTGLSLGSLRAVEDDDDDDERRPAIAYSGQEYAIAYIDVDLTSDNAYVKSVSPERATRANPRRA